MNRRSFMLASTAALASVVGAGVPAALAAPPAPEDTAFTGYGYLDLTEIFNGKHYIPGINKIELHQSEYEHVRTCLDNYARFVPEASDTHNQLLQDKTIFNYLESEGAIVVVNDRSHWPVNKLLFS